MTTYTGRCHCGDVKYEVHGDISSFICHCDSCKKNASAPFVAWSRVSQNDFKLIQGKLKEYKSSSKVIRTNCERCGVGIGYAHEDSPLDLDLLTVTLDDYKSIKPLYHLMVEEKVPWIGIDDDLPRYQKWRDD